MFVREEHLTDRERNAYLVELHDRARRLDAEILRLTRRAEERSAFLDEGCLSMGAFLAARCGMGRGVAHARVLLARALGRMPIAAAAHRDGRLCLEQLRALAKASEHPSFTGSEALLVEQVAALAPAHAAVVVERWSTHVGGGSEPTVETTTDRVHLSSTFDGRTRLDGELHGDAGDIVRLALDHVAGARNDDGRPRSRRRADALVELCSLYLAGALPGGRQRAQVIVTVPLAELARRGAATTSHGAVVRGEALRRLACDAAVVRVVTDGASQPLDVGRATRTVGAAQWTALVVRDGGCAFPTCDRPVGWCDAHHLAHWIDGGRTDLANLVLLCRRHHRLVHEGGWRLHRDEGGLVVTRPDGTKLANGPPRAA